MPPITPPASQIPGISNSQMDSECQSIEFPKKIDLKLEHETTGISSNFEDIWELREPARSMHGDDRNARRQRRHLKRTRFGSATISSSLMSDQALLMRVVVTTGTVAEDRAKNTELYYKVRSVERAPTGTRTSVQNRTSPARHTTSYPAAAGSHVHLSIELFVSPLGSPGRLRERPQRVHTIYLGNYVGDIDDEAAEVLDGQIFLQEEGGREGALLEGEGIPPVYKHYIHHHPWASQNSSGRAHGRRFRSKRPARRRRSKGTLKDERNQHSKLGDILKTQSKDGSGVNHLRDNTRMHMMRETNKDFHTKIHWCIEHTEPSSISRVPNHHHCWIVVCATIEVNFVSTSKAKNTHEAANIEDKVSD
ncbi:hypothetical protein B0H17DRAFT_1302540 [Mycena rosella]|uniref:Uncharacterized protein n=1 Tax=Mycena rosella TaxID=1033263 RepID=A0AAD7DAB8_MYCRO|nr:hypothetical protein B0H17DRAFT_1302540 [Mycena rosella]